MPELSALIIGVIAISFVIFVKHWLHDIGIDKQYGLRETEKEGPRHGQEK